MRDWITFLRRVSGKSVDLISSCVFSVSGIPESQTTGSLLALQCSLIGPLPHLCSLGAILLIPECGHFSRFPDYLGNGGVSPDQAWLSQITANTNVYSAMVHCGVWKSLFWFLHPLAVAGMGPCGGPLCDLCCWCCCQQHLEWPFSTWETETLCPEIWLIQNHQPEMDEYWFPWEQPDREVSLTQKKGRHLVIWKIPSQSVCFKVLRCLWCIWDQHTYLAVTLSPDSIYNMLILS